MHAATAMVGVHKIAGELVGKGMANGIATRELASLS